MRVFSSLVASFMFSSRDDYRTGVISYAACLMLLLSSNPILGFGVGGVLFLLNSENLFV